MLLIRVLIAFRLQLVLAGESKRQVLVESWRACLGLWLVPGHRILPLCGVLLACLQLVIGHIGQQGDKTLLDETTLIS